MAFPNPGGRPKEKPFRDALLMALKEAGEDHKTLRGIANALITRAEQGEIQAIKEIADRLDGKVPQGIEGGDPENPVKMVFGWLPNSGS